MKKDIRNNFREAVFKRDNYKCRVCGAKNTTIESFLDAHHITNREIIVNGGYVAANGISLCPECHIKAEAYFSGKEIDGYLPEQLYDLIGSSYEKAIQDSHKLNKGVINVKKK